MNFTAGSAAALIVACVALGGCVTRDDLREAQDRIDTADRHAGLAQARADEAYGIGSRAQGRADEAYGIGGNAMRSADRANAKADMTASDVEQLKRQVANLENRPQPHHKKKVRHHRSNNSSTAHADQPKPNNS
jgi:hypothetical protein